MIATIQNAEAQKIFQKVTIRFIHNNRFFTSIISKLKRVEDFSCKTMWTDGIHLGYSPDFVLDNSLEENEVIIVHEILHVVLCHPVRQGTRENEMWNIACDHVVNLEIKYNTNYKLPDNCLCDDRFRGMTSEQVYSVLHRERQEQRDKEKQEQEDQQNSEQQEQENEEQSDNNFSDPESNSSETGESNGDGNSSNEETEDESKESDQSNDLGDESGEEKGQQDGQSQENSECNDIPSESESKSTNNQEIDREPEKAKTDITEIRKPSQSAEENEVIEEQIKTMVRAAIQQCEKSGNAPGGLDRTIKDLLESEVPWREIVNLFTTEKMNSDYSYKKPSRRTMNTGFILPSLSTEVPGTPIIAFDTSGSQDHNLIKDCVSEITGVMDTFDNIGKTYRLPIIYCDTLVQKVELLESGEVPSPKGGGGTLASPVFDYIEDNEDEEELQNPIGLIFFTDGHIPEHDLKKIEEPEYPVLWMLTINNQWFEPPFGEVHIMKEY